MNLMPRIPLPQNILLKIVVILLAIPVILYFLPFLIGGFIMYYVFRNVSHSVVKLSIIVGILLPTLFVGSAWAVGLKEGVTNPSTVEMVTVTPTEIPAATETPTPTVTPVPTFGATHNGVLAKVVRVIDGDTIEIEGGKKVRYIGINTPETVDPTKGTECYGEEASKRNKELVEGKTVELVKDVSETDRYGRLLRYVYTESAFINLYLVAGGHAYASTYPPDVAQQAALTQAQKQAREDNIGLWSMCSASPTPAKSPTLAPVKKVVYPTATPRPFTPTATPIPSVQGATTQSNYAPSSGSSGSTAGGDKDCADFSSHAEAQAFFLANGGPGSDPHRLDGDNDGQACED
jgi:micrococcal nuclease